ncbi:MAG: hypothetical protein KAJ95_09680 [Gammaproteobacteria bacterium]|nr:hypothetical protein [Gammaproteobacteria bacterium]
MVAVFICNPLHAKNKDKPLPPGLQKKVDRGESLPPGWQKKLHKGEILDYQVYRHGRVVIPVNHEGILTINVDGKLIRLMEATREIIDILL